MARNHNDLPRVVVTLGSVDAFWENLKAGRSGIRRITLFDPSELNVQIAGEVDFEPDKYIDRKSARRMNWRSQSSAQSCPNAAPAGRAAPDRW